ADVGPGGDRVEYRLEDADRRPAAGAEIAGGAHDTAEIPAAREEVRRCGQVPGVGEAARDTPNVVVQAEDLVQHEHRGPPPRRRRPKDLERNGDAFRAHRAALV